VYTDGQVPQMRCRSSMLVRHCIETPVSVTTTVSVFYRLQFQATGRISATKQLSSFAAL